MISIYYDTKKISLKGYDCKFENNLRDAKLSLSSVDKISEFLKSPVGEDIEIDAVDKKKEAKLSSIFHCIDAAGGLVKNDEGNYLFIFRRNKWDLPKGKVDPGESNEEAAVREVREECGIDSLTIENFICCTHHIYPLKEKMILKTTYWYLMTTPGDPKLTPQTEEDITDILWLNAGNIQNVKSNTFPSVIEVLKSCFIH